MTKFMSFWLTINYLLQSRGQPEMLFGEAHAAWKEINERICY
jgi:hypothetical protein